MQNYEQNADRIHRDCEEITKYLEGIYTISDKVEISDYVVKAEEHLVSIKNTLLSLGISFQEKEDQTKILRDGLKQLEFEFDDGWD